MEYITSTLFWLRSDRVVHHSQINRWRIGSFNTSTSEFQTISHYTAEVLISFVIGIFGACTVQWAGGTASLRGQDTFGMVKWQSTGRGRHGREGI
ncbi:hypothetical protein BDW75DRAFT_220384 [Aspergillus navahoensis]